MRSGSFLQAMALSSRQRAQALIESGAASALERRIQALPSVGAPAFHEPGFDVIAEVKRRSPASGALDADGLGIVNRARAYESSGATAISVLTEPSEFNGTIADLEVVASTVHCPVMRKDFLVDPIQLLEARAHGAAGALLIVRLLDGDTSDAMMRNAAELGMFVLLEIFSEDDVPGLERALADAARHGATACAGVNCRDLTTLVVDPHTHEALLPLVPVGVPVVAESGVTKAEDAAHLARLGYRAALVGTALMRAPDPGTMIGACLDVGRRAARTRVAP